MSNIAPKDTHKTRKPLFPNWKHKKYIFKINFLEFFWKSLIVPKKEQQLASLIFLKPKPRMKAREVSFDQLKVSEKRCTEPKKDLFHNHYGNSSIPRDQKVTERSPLRLVKHVSFTEILKAKKCETFRKFFFVQFVQIFIYFAKSHSAENQEAIYARETLCFC